MTSMRMRPFLMVAGLIALQAFVLFLYGQPAICECGYVKVWESTVASSGNSQHLTDWYTFSHVLHGLLFYLGLWLLFPRMPFVMRLVIAVGIEAGWELSENTPMVINHYRQQALAQGYTGDSIVNSVGDTLAMMAGFFAAWRLPIFASIAIGVAAELFMAYSIRDNLTLNIINLIHVFPAVAHWQAGA